MHRAIVLVVVFLLIPGHGITRAEDPLDRLIYPLAAPRAAQAVKFEIDLSEVPGDERTADWARRGQALCSNWFPIVCRLLATDGWTPPDTIQLVFKKELRVPAATSGAKIEISHDWITKNPDDFGMLIHELTHVIQAYPPGTQPGWLVEGIADYIRYWRFEPERPHPQIDPERSDYRQGYGTSAAFLAWMLHKYDQRLIHCLDDALRHARYQETIFQDATGKDLDALWKEFLASKR